MSRLVKSALFLIAISAFFNGVAMMATSPDPSSLTAKGGENNSKTEVTTGFNWSFYNITALTVAVLAVSAGFAAIVSLFLPLFAYKICYLLGGCKDTLDVYVDKFIASDGRVRRFNQRSIDDLDLILATLAKADSKYSGDHKRTNDENVVTRSKRAMEYVEPVLATLANAYEEYAGGDLKKKSNRPIF